MRRPIRQGYQPKKPTELPKGKAPIPPIGGSNVMVTITEEHFKDFERLVIENYELKEENKRLRNFIKERK